MKTHTLNLLFFFLFFVGISNAQEPTDTTKKVVVTTSDGKQRVGIILSDDGREILLLTEDVGKIYIRKEGISSIKSIDEVEIDKYDNEYRSTSPFTTRYYFTTNALPIKKNEDYAMIHLYGPEVHFSLSDRLSLGVMTSWIASPFVVAAKYTIPTKNPKLNFGLGTILGTSGYLNTFRGYGGLHWGMVTFGDRMKNITFSAGYSYVQPGTKRRVDIPGTYTNNDPMLYYPEIPQRTEKSALVKAPVIGIGGIARVGKKASFIFDSMIFFYSFSGDGLNREYTYTQDPVNFNTTKVVVKAIENDPGTVFFLMPGMRFQNTDKSAFQFALAGLTTIRNSDMNAVPVPMCSWFFKF